MRSIAARLWALAVLATLAACGGGGGGGDSARPALLTFAPTTVTANVQEGASATITVRGTGSEALLQSNSALYVFVVDPSRVLLPDVQLSNVDDRTLAATLHTSPGLAVGRYRGSFQVRVCRDPNCTSEFAGSPVPLPYDITISAAPLVAVTTTSTQATVNRGATMAQTFTAQVSGPSLAWTATASAPWVSVSPASGTGPGSFTIRYLTADLAEGTYSGTVTVRSSDGQTATIPTGLQVLPAAFVINGGLPSFAAVNGAPIPAQTLSFAINNDVPTAWTGVSSAPWMIATPLSGTTPATVTLRPDPTRGPLASGVYTSDLVLSAAGIANRTVTTQLTLAAPTLSAPAISLTLGGPRGRDLSSAQSMAVSLNTGTASWPFTLSGLPAWLQSSTPTGTVNQAGTSISVSPRVAAVTAGSSSATIAVNAVVNGDSVTLPLTVNLNADQRRLIPSEWGVAFTSTPNGSVLSRTLSVSDNFGSTGLTWVASSDAAWLSVTPTGGTATTALALTANPAALPQGVVSHATVTVSTTAAPGVLPAIIRVALWKNGSGLANIVRLPDDYAHVVADTLRPFVYAHNRGTSIDVFNAHTAQKIATIGGVGAALGPMSVSPDGSRLYALDTAGRAMAVVNLDTQSLAATWALGAAVDAGTGLLAIRPNGTEVVLVGDGSAYVNGRALASNVRSFLGAMSATADGKRVLTLGGVYSVDFSAMSGGVLFTEYLVALNTNSGGNERDVVIARDGARAYSASGGGVNEPGRYRCAIADPRDGSYIGSLPGGDAYPNAVKVTVDGRAICGISGWYATYDIWVHAPNGALLQGHKFAGYARALKDRQLVVTADGLVAVGLTDDPVIAFVPIGGP